MTLTVHERDTLRRLGSLAALLLASVALVSPLFALDFVVPLVVEGDSIAGGGHVLRIDNLALNSSGRWIVQVDSDASAEMSAVLLDNDGVLAREADAVASPPGALIDGFDAVSVNEAGEGAFNFSLRATTSSADDGGVYVAPWNDPLRLVVQDGAGAPSLPTATMVGVFDVEIAADDRVLVIATVDEPSIPSTSDRAIYVWEVNPATGDIVDSRLIALEGDVLPGQAIGLVDLGIESHQSAINSRGEVIFQADVPGADAIYLWTSSSFDLLARRGDPSPVSGRAWESLTSTAVDLNDSGSYVIRAVLDGDPASNALLVRDGVSFRQQGDVLPALGAYHLTSFGLGPVEIANTGEVLWYGDWDDPDTTIDSGLFVDDELIVQEGVTEIPGLGIIDTIRDGANAYHISDSGRYVIFEAVLEGGIEGAFWIDREPSAAAEFRRGDANGDGSFDIADVIATLGALFSPGTDAIDCLDAADSNDDGSLDISDAVYSLAALFSGGGGVSSDCDADFSSDALTCQDYAHCP